MRSILEEDPEGVAAELEGIRDVETETEAGG